MLRILLLFMTFVVTLSSTAYALQTSSPLAIDNRIKTYVYSPNDVYIYTGHYRYQSSIIFEQGEEIITVSMGDTLGWQMIPSGNRLFLKPISPEATTNMTILTSKRQYLFELYAEEAEDIRDDEITFTVKFVYPDADSSKSASGGLGSASFRTYSVSTDDSSELEIIKEEEINRNYAFSGNAGVVPLEIFDDGEFTYMEFKNKNANLPAIFKVNRDGNESLVNFRIMNNYVVVEEVAQQFTLRLGTDIACIFNESDPIVRAVAEEEKILGLF